MVITASILPAHIWSLGGVIVSVGSKITGVFSSSQKIPTNYEGRRLITAVTSARQLDPAHTPKSHVLKTILILSSHLRLDITSGLFHSGFPT